MELRQYQRDCANAVWLSWKRFDRVAAVLATGCGKTLIAAKIIEHFCNQGERCLFLCNRDELIRQAVDKISQATGMLSAVEKAGETAEGALSPVTVGSVQTLMREARLNRFDQSHYDKIVVDECHYATAKSFRAVLDHFGKAKVLGITATFMRNDKKHLGTLFEDIAYEYNLKDAINDGWLSKIVAQTVPLEIDLHKVRMKQGDFRESDLHDSIAPYLDEIAASIKELASDRKVLIFTPLIQTSKAMVQALENVGLAARHIDGKSPDRHEILDDYHRDKIRILSNALLLTHGYDEPSIDCIVNLRPTKSTGLYIQITGRGTRLCDGKDHLLLLDYLWSTSRHKLNHPASLVCDTEEEAERVTDAVNGGGGPVDVEEAVKDAQQSIANDREAKLAKYIDANRNRKPRTIDPTEFGICVLSDKLIEYEPVFNWQKQKASEDQIRHLANLGFDSEGITAGYAAEILSEVKSRRNNGLATPKQVRCLLQNGYKNAARFTFEQASETMNWLAEHRWKKKRRKR